MLQFYGEPYWDCIVKIEECMGRMSLPLKFESVSVVTVDHCDGINRLQIFDFTNSCDKFRNYITENVKAMAQYYPYPFSYLWPPTSWPPFQQPRRWLSRWRPVWSNCRRCIEGYAISYFFGKITSNTDTMINVFRSIIGDFLVYNFEGNPTALADKFFVSTCSSNATSISLNE
jgi:hypothetical protein